MVSDAFPKRRRGRPRKHQVSVEPAQEQQQAEETEQITATIVEPEVSDAPKAKPRGRAASKAVAEEAADGVLRGIDLVGTLIAGEEGHLQDLERDLMKPVIAEHLRTGAHAGVAKRLTLIMAAFGFASWGLRVGSVALRRLDQGKKQKLQTMPVQPQQGEEQHVEADNLDGKPISRFDVEKLMREFEQ